jgi:O-antigen/teichoic acid export membrane protein
MPRAAVGRALRAFVVDAYLRKLARNSGWLYAATVAGLIAGAVQTIVAARFLGAADYGRVALVIVSVGAIEQLIDVRTWEFVTRYLAEFTERGQHGLALATLKIALVSEYIVAGLALVATLIAAGPIADRLLGDPDLQPLIMLYAVALLGTALNGTATAILRVFDRFRELALQSAGQSFLRLVSVSVALAIGGDLRSVIIAYLVSEAAAAVSLAFLSGRQVRRHLWQARAESSWSAVRPYARGMAGFMGHSALRATLKLGNRNLDILLLGHFRTAAEVGHYRIARSLGGIGLQVTDPLYFTVFPEFARHWVSSRQRFWSLLKRAAAIGMALAVPIVVVGFLLARPAFDIAVGEEYLDAIEPFRVILLAIGVAVATFWATPAALGSANPRVATVAFTAGVAVQVVLLLALVPDHGATGAAFALLGFYLAWAAAMLAGLRNALRAAPDSVPGAAPLETPPAGQGR